MPGARSGCGTDIHIGIDINEKDMGIVRSGREYTDIKETVWSPVED